MDGRDAGGLEADQRFCLGVLDFSNKGSPGKMKIRFLVWRRDNSLCILGRRDIDIDPIIEDFKSSGSIEASHHSASMAILPDKSEISPILISPFPSSI